MNYLDSLAKLVKKGNLREFRPLADKNEAFVRYNGARMLNLTSNDYLGIAADKTIHQKFYENLSAENILENYGLGAASSRLLTGDSYPSHDLEDFIRKQYGSSGCLLFNSGYHANIGILPALTTKKDLILSDKLNHASIHDGMRLSRAEFKRFRHTDYDHLTALLEQTRKEYENVYIVTESVFSMDGDVADLARLIDIKNRYNCLLYVDEAHGVGVYGARGLGKVEELDAIAEVDLIVGTFGKAFASVGAYLVCSAEIAAYLINYSRSLIFTTALPPVVIHWNLYIFKEIVKMEAARRKLSELGCKLRQGLEAQGLNTGGSTNIVPVVIGDNRKTVDLAEKMLEHGYLIFAVRPPTVPEGTARFRLSLTAAMEWTDIASLPEIIKDKLC